MYLILPTEQAEARNKAEAQNRGCGDVTNKWWSEITIEGETALNVGDGEGLTGEELAQTVNELPDRFLPKDDLI